MKAAKTVAHAILLALVFVMAVIAGVLLHLDTPVARRFVVARVDAALASTFEGRLTIEHVDHIGLGGISGGRVRVTAPDGTLVIAADGVRARVSAVAIARSALFGKGPIAIDITEATIDHAEVNLDTDASGTALLARAFTTRPTPSAPAKPPGRGVKLAIGRVVVTHAWVHGRPAAGPPIDADVDRLAGRLDVSGDAVDVEVSHVALRTRAMSGLDPAGDARVKLGVPLALDTVFDGTVAGVTTNIHFALAGKRLDATLDAPRVPPEKIRALAPDVPIEKDVKLHVEAHGELPKLDVVFDLTLADGSGTLHATSALTVGGETHAVVTASARDVDLRAFGRPRSSLGADLRGDITVKADGTIAAHADVDVLAGVAGTSGAPVPPATLHADIEKTAAGVSIRGGGRVAEPGAPADVTFALGPSGVVDFTVRASIPHIERVARAKKAASGSAEVRARGKIRLADKTIDATLDADLHDVAKGEQRAGRGHVTVHATGPIEEPIIDAVVVADDVAVGGNTFPHARVTARGRATAPHVDATLGGGRAPDVHASADVDVATATVSNVKAEITRDHEVVTARVGSIRVSGGELRVEDAVVEGLGAPARASVHTTADGFTIRLHARRLALERIARLLHLEREVHGGVVDLDVELVVDRRGATGNVLADVSHASISSAKDVNAHVDGTFEGRRARADVHASLADVAEVDLKTSNLVFGGEGPLSLGSWRKGWGRIDLDGRVDLAKLYALLPPATLPFSGVRGALVVKGRAARDTQTDETPEIVLSMKTEGFVAEKPALAGVDAAVEMKVDGDTGVAAIAARLLDAEGELVSVDARSDAIPYREIFSANEGLADRLTRTPFTARIVVPPRELAKLPLGYALADASGEIEATADIEGSARAPRVSLTAGARGIGLRGGLLAVPLDAQATGRYDGNAATLDLEVRSPKTTLLDATTRVTAPIDDLFASRPLGWSASGSARLHAFPLGRIAPLNDLGVRGAVTGELSVDGLHTSSPSAKIDLAITNAQVGSAKYTRAALSASVADKTFRGTARIEQSDGSIEATATAGVLWEHTLGPLRDDAAPLDATLRAKSFRASGLQPFFDDVFTELDGRIDGDAHVALAEGGAKLNGALALTDGLVQLASTGTELHEATAKLSMTPDGTIRLDDFSARGLTGRVTGNATAHVAGLRFVDAAGSVKIKKGEAIPIELQDARIGDVYGDVAVRAKAAPEKKLVTVDVDVSSLVVVLPLASPHPVRDLDSLPNVHVGFYRAGAFSPLTVDGRREAEAKAPQTGTETDVAIHLRDVEVSRGKSLAVSLDGEPILKLAGSATMTGQIRLKSGTLEVQGKKFEIEKGTVTFVGKDATNPLVVVTAGWTAQDGTRVYADFTGPLKTGTVTLRSEPARPKSEILALILFGSADGSETTPYGTQNTAAAAGSAAGGLATEGLTRGIDQLTGLDVATKIDTSNAQNPRPEVEVQIARSISLQIAFVLGTPPPGTNPDKTFATIDWRFLRRWSLQTTFGDQGSSFADLVWQYRY